MRERRCALRCKINTICMCGRYLCIDRAAITSLARKNTKCQTSFRSNGIEEWAWAALCGYVEITNWLAYLKVLLLLLFDAIVRYTLRTKLISTYRSTIAHSLLSFLCHFWCSQLSNRWTREKGREREKKQTTNYYNREKFFGGLASPRNSSYGFMFCGMFLF